MPVITCDTRIEAPIDLCFDLARDVGIHCETAADTRERAVPPGKTAGLLELGDVVTFEATHFAIRWRLTARIVEMEPPLYFVDQMERGPFAFLRHAHEFSEVAGATLMRDVMEWRSRCGPAGACVDAVLLRRHLHRFLTARGTRLKKTAEARVAMRIPFCPPSRFSGASL
jgi:ligand-binding SRPBCC domain-containing protein